MIRLVCCFGGNSSIVEKTWQDSLNIQSVISTHVCDHLVGQIDRSTYFIEYFRLTVLVVAGQSCFIEIPISRSKLNTSARLLQPATHAPLTCNAHTRTKSFAFQRWKRVARGRCQIVGDTVTTALRMESARNSDQTHISSVYLLLNAGKSLQVIIGEDKDAQKEKES